MKYIGAHVSAEGGVFNAPLNAKQIGAEAFALFLKSQKQWQSKQYTQEVIINFKTNLKETGILPANVLAHSGYLINLGHPDENSRKKSLEALIDEIQRCEQLGIEKIVVHPGSHLKLIAEKECLDFIGASINEALAATKVVAVLIENTAGQGGNVGYKFEHLADLVRKIKNKKRIGICIDTCHLFASGYDFTTKRKFDEIWQEFDSLVGLEYIKGFHLNDSKGGLGSRLDRHESLGKGMIGIEPFKLFMQDSRFDNIPFILETSDPEIWDQEIRLLKGFASQIK